MKKDDGFSTAPVLFIIFSICVMVLSIVSLVNSRGMRLKAVKNMYAEKDEACVILNNIINDFNQISDNKYDNERNPGLLNILNKYSCFGIRIKDVSTGINEMFLSNKIHEDQNVKKIIEYYSDEIKTEFGWINAKLENEKMMKSICEDFSSDEFYQLFPLINQLPLYNVYNMNKDFIFAILKINSIDNAEEKALTLYKKCLSEDFDEKEIIKVLGVSENNSVLFFLGTRTTFWRINFETEMYFINAVIAAVPYKKEKEKKIEKYILIEKNIKYKGGSFVANKNN